MHVYACMRVYSVCVPVTVMCVECRCQIPWRDGAVGGLWHAHLSAVRRSRRGTGPGATLSGVCMQHNSFRVLTLKSPAAAPDANMILSSRLDLPLPLGPTTPTRWGEGIARWLSCQDLKCAAEMFEMNQCAGACVGPGTARCLMVPFVCRQGRAQRARDLRPHLKKR